jgi:hypothetical protein
MLKYIFGSGWVGGVWVAGAAVSGCSLSLLLQKMENQNEGERWSSAGASGSRRCRVAG